MISVLLADDNLIVREGVKAMLLRESDIDVVAVAADKDELLAEAARCDPQVVVTDIRMPPDFRSEGIDAAREVRQRTPGTGVVILSQYDDPEYAISLLAEGSAGYGYLLKQHVADGDQLAQAVRAVATGGTSLDPLIVDALTSPVKDGSLSAKDEALLKMVAEGRPIKAIAVARRVTPEAAAADVERLFKLLAEGAAAGQAQAIDRLRSLHQAIVDREEQGESLSRLLPSRLVERLQEGGMTPGGEPEMLHVTVLMADIRGYSTIAEHADPAALARQLNEHRSGMNDAILGAGGTVMQFVGDAVMAVFGAPFAQPDHPVRAAEAARRMHLAQWEINERWRAESLPEFRIGIGLSTGDAAAALLGSAERLEYTLVGDTVNLAQRLQQWADEGEIVLSDATWAAVRDDAIARIMARVEELPPAQVKGRGEVVRAYKATVSAERVGTGEPT